MSSGRHPVLLRIAETLLQMFPQTSIQGEDAAAFIFVEADDNAVEVSMLDEKRIWVEFWDLAKGESAPPIKEETYDTEEGIVRAVAQWLSSNPGERNA